MMTFFLPSSADILGIIALIFLCYLIKQNNFMEKNKSRYYLFVAGVTGVIIMLEILTDYLSYHGVKEQRVPLILANIFGFSLMFGLPTILAILYSPKIAEKKWLILLPIWAGAGLCICSSWTGWIFWIDTAGIYHRGKFFLLNTLITIYSYIVLLAAHIEMAKEYDASEKVYLWTLYVIVIGTGGIQILIPKMEIMWGAVAITELLYYVFLRELKLKIDAVTGVRNRFCFQKQIDNLRPDESLFLVVFDVNNLKYINDTYGHAAGDEFLKRSAALLKTAYQKCGIVYRTGGDEFAVIAPNCSKVRLNQARELMMKLMAEMRKEYSMDYYIANAYSHFDAAVHHTVQECLNEADRRMYEDKKQSKRYA